MSEQVVPLASPPRRRTPGRPRVHPSEPPNKKRRYIPGGPGGGGRWIDTGSSEYSDNVAAMRLSRNAGAGNLGLEHSLEADGHVMPGNSRATPSRPRRERDRERTRRRTTTAPRPRYSSAAAAAAASQASDGYKPREERSWEEFHPELDLEAALMVFTADEVDGITKNDAPLSLARQATMNSDALGDATDKLQNQAQEGGHPPSSQLSTTQPVETPKRRPGRPPRRTDAMLTGLGSPPAPRILPMPNHNPKERLNLPKPSYRMVDTFMHYEQDRAVQVNYVDKSMASVGYQEGDRFDMPKHFLIRHVEGPYDDDLESALRLESDEKLPDALPVPVRSVEYDMDEQDDKWLEAHNLYRKEEGIDPIKPSMFEITMTQIEREYHALEKRIPKPSPRHPQTHRPRSSSAAAVNGELSGPGDEPDTKCVICDDGDCENANAIIFCDGCDLAVHQECYGVPFIPEGQWFCRKCKEIGRGTPTCIFCPNVDGAFKQTNTLRWSHLLCAIWIPEVTIANTTFMEPITDVEKVPKTRWALNCYICNQKMGACIQCGNKACYQAFHVTCARRARLFLRMKSTHAGGIDSSVLKAFCDRHVPPDWRREHEVESAIFEAKRYYRHKMRDRRWADSQTATLAITTAQQENSFGAADEADQGDDTIIASGSKRKKIQPQKTGWRLPSGAPVVPAVVYNTVDNSLVRFAIRRRKEFLVEACKYWTLKREARKGAALLKRLQLQLESFTPMEITRRNFQAMGSAGRARLLRRIEFADILHSDVSRLQSMVQMVRQREEIKLADTETLKELMDTVYFPITPLLWPILQKAQKLDEKTEVFKEGLDALEVKLSDRYYTSVAAFSADLTAVLSPAMTGLQGDTSIRDIADIHEQLNGVALGTAQHLALSQEQKELKRLTKRITKAMKEMLDVAGKKEAELKGIPFAKEMAEWAALESRLESSGMPKTSSNPPGDDTPDDAPGSVIGGACPSPKTNNAIADEDTVMQDAEGTNGEPREPAAADAIKTNISHPLSPPSSTSSNIHVVQNGVASAVAASIAEGLPSDTGRLLTSIEDPWANGGVPWYLEAFDISGTTVQDERWTGKRAMSEALSEMDEETLLDLKEQSNGNTEKKDGSSSTATAASSRPRRTTRASTAADLADEEAAAAAAAAEGEADEQEGAEEEEVEEEEVEEEKKETEEERIAREKREKRNAKRRAQRRKW